MSVIVIGAGIGGLTLALSLHRAGMACQVVEAVPEIKPLGVGINLLPHATRVLSTLGLRNTLAGISIETQEFAFFNHHGQFILSEPCGRWAGYDWPQFSVHRGELQMALFDAVRRELGADAVRLGHGAKAVEETDDGVIVHVADPDGTMLDPVAGTVAIACDGTNSAIRRQLYPNEGAPVYSGINMWRGVTRAKPFLTGASHTRVGALKTGKLVIYPIRDNVDSDGNQLVNWVAEIQSDTYEKNDWNKPGRLEDFYDIYKDWQFDWLDAAALLRNADQIFEYPMVDRDPLPRWSFGRTTLLGDAAHPMYPRGANGAAQAILDAEALTGLLVSEGPTPAALTAYDAARREAANKVVLTNRSTPPDHIINTVEELTGGKPFERIEDVIDPEELRRISESYKSVAGYSKAALDTRSGGR